MTHLLMVAFELVAVSWEVVRRRMVHGAGLHAGAVQRGAPLRENVCVKVTVTATATVTVSKVRW